MINEIKGCTSDRATMPGLKSAWKMGICLIFPPFSRECKTFFSSQLMSKIRSVGPHQANLVLVAYASSEGSGEPAHSRSLARTSTARSYRQWVKRNLQTESQIPSPSEWLSMRSYNLSWRNARRYKFTWRGSFSVLILLENLEPNTYYNVFLSLCMYVFRDLTHSFL